MKIHAAVFSKNLEYGADCELTVSAPKNRDQLFTEFGLIFSARFPPIVVLSRAGNLITFFITAREDLGKMHAFWRSIF